MIGSKELLFIALIVFILFGAASIPKFAKSIGLAKREFEKGLKGDEKDTDSTSNIESKK